MGVLTTNERDALEDVFLSIHSKKKTSSIIKQSGKNVLNSFKVAKTGVKNTKFYKFIRIFYKKKKNLSK